MSDALEPGPPLTPPPPGAGAARPRLGQAAFASVYADVVIAVLSILLVPYLIGRLGTEPYGILGVVSVLAGQLGVLHFGVGTAATRLVADSIARGGRELRARLVRAVRAFFDDLFSNPAYQPHDLTAAQICDADELRFTRDPFDGLIVAAARDLGLPLMTRDVTIRESGRVRTIW